MRKVLAGAVVVAGVCGLMMAAQAAEGKPIQELPGDLVKWSTLWVEVPRQMYGVGQEEGPVAAITWGPVKGTVMFVSATTKTLWDAAQSEKRQGHRPTSKQPVGAILRYEF